MPEVEPSPVIVHRVQWPGSGVADNPFVLDGLMRFISDKFPNSSVVEVWDDGGHAATLHLKETIG